MEELSAKDEKLSRVLGSLPLADTPEGFEGAVRSRIAERRSTASFARPTLLLALKFALPLVVLVFLGVFLIVSNDATGLAELIPPVTGSDNNELAELPVSPSPESELPVVNSNGDPRAATAANRKRSTSIVGSPGGSEDFGLSQDDTAVFPPGVDPRKANVTNTGPPVSGSISPISLLSFIGVTSVCSPVSCTVRSVQADSPADRAGVRVGDVIETIGDSPISSSRNAAISVDRLGVVRDGKRITISLVFR